MAHVREQRAEKILEDLLLPYLESGVIPSTDRLETEYNKEIAQFGPLTRSSLSSIELPERWSESSASRFNTIAQGVKSDTLVLLRSLAILNKLSINLLSEWSARGRALQARVRKLKSRVESLLLTNSETAGYLAFVEDNFFSLEKVSSDTTAEIDPRMGEVSIAVDRTEPVDIASGGTRIDTTNAEISIALIEQSNVKYTTLPPGSNTQNILKDNKTRWGMEANGKKPSSIVSSNSGSKPIILEVKIQLFEAKEISRLILVSSDATAGSNSVVAAQYSLDGYRWEQVPSLSSVQSGTGNFSFRFPKTEMKWIKFIISKAAPDAWVVNGSLVDFGIESIKFYSEQFQITDGSSLVTTDLYPRVAGDKVSFGRAALDVCQELPEGTSIEYFLRAYKASSSSYTDWIQTYPLIENKASVIDFEAPVTGDTSDIETTFNSSLNAEVLNTERSTGSTDIDYRFFSVADMPLNFYLATDLDSISDLTLLRNIGYSSGKYPTVNQDKKVGDIPCGWGLKGDNIYYCRFRVKNPDGIKIDFGDTTAVIDNRSVGGVVSLSPGWHSFETRRANWVSLSSSIFSSAPTSASELEAGDPLYPYNHKYLIEGYDYPDEFSGEKVYLGVDQYGERICNRIPLSQFQELGTDLDVYATDLLDNGYTLFLLKHDASRPSFSNERSRLFYTASSRSYDAIQLKAILKSVEEDKTPVLTYYRIKVK